MRTRCRTDVLPIGFRVAPTVPDECPVRVRFLSVKVHAPFQVVAYVGHAVKMNQVVFAVADDGQNLFAMRGSKTAVQLFGLTFLKIRDYFLGSAQIVAFLRIIVGRMLGKIATTLKPEVGSAVISS